MPAVSVRSRMGSGVRGDLECQLDTEDNVAWLCTARYCLPGLLVEYSWGRPRRDGYGCFADLLLCSSDYLDFGFCCCLKGSPGLEVYLKDHVFELVRRLRAIRSSFCMSPV